jgi:phage tail-like protein
MPSNTTRVDPLRSFNFRVEIDGRAVASFSEVSGIVMDGAPAVEYREGKDPINYVRKLTGLRKTGNVTLKRGYTTDSTIIDLYTLTATGDPNGRFNGSLVLRDETQTDVLFFPFTGAFINKIEGAHMLASGNEVAIESAEMVVETITMKVAK